MYIAEISPAENFFHLKNDEYIPLEVQVGSCESTALYFRYLSDYSLLELGVSPKTGVLNSIKLVQVPGVSVGELPKSPSLIEEGLPVFDISLWFGKKYLDIKKPVEVLLGENSISVLLDSTLSVNKFSRSQGINFGLSNGYPCWLRLDNISAVEIEAVRTAIEQSSYGKFM